MINIKNTKIYYKTVTPDKSFDYIVYGFIRANGAFCSAYLIAKYPQTFIGAGLFSGGGSGYEQLIRENAFADPAQKIYIDIGNGDFIEKQLLPGTESMIEYLKNKGFVQGQNICAQICDKAKHNEEEWSKRFPTFLEFMLK